MVPQIVCTSMAVTQNITKFTRKEPVRIRARKEDTKLNAPSSKSQRSNSLKVYASMKSRAGRTMGSNRTDNGANRIENRI